MCHWQNKILQVWTTSKWSRDGHSARFIPLTSLSLSLLQDVLSILDQTGSFGNDDFGEMSMFPPFPEWSHFSPSVPSLTVALLCAISYSFNQMDSRVGQNGGTGGSRERDGCVVRMEVISHNVRMQEGDRRRSAQTDRQALLKCVHFETTHTCTLLAQAVPTLSLPYTHILWFFAGDEEG